MQARRSECACPNARAGRAQIREVRTSRAEPERCLPVVPELKFDPDVEPLYERDYRLKLVA